jgi:hypothetical protein
MALAKEVMRGGLSAGQASALGGGYVSVAAAGSAITDATAVTASNAVVTAADGTKGVILVGQVGDSQTIFNSSGSTLKVYPDSTASSIAVPGTGSGTLGAAYSHTTYAVVTYTRVSSTLWLPNKSA